MQATASHAFLQSSTVAPCQVAVGGVRIKELNPMITTTPSDVQLEDARLT